MSLVVRASRCRLATGDALPVRRQGRVYMRRRWTRIMASGWPITIGRLLISRRCLFTFILSFSFHARVTNEVIRCKGVM